MERSGNFYKAIRLGYILISILIGCMAYNSLYEWQEIEALELGNKKIDELTKVLTPLALKGQKLLAQGNALGIMAINKAPCKGKSFVYCPVFEGFCPFRATGLRPKLPRALPWARGFCPFRACCLQVLMG